MIVKNLTKINHLLEKASLYECKLWKNGQILGILYQDA